MPSPPELWSVRELKVALDERGVSYAGCTEKSELIERYHNSTSTTTQLHHHSTTTTQLHRHSTPPPLNSTTTQLDHITLPY